MSESATNEPDAVPAAADSGDEMETVRRRFFWNLLSYSGANLVVQSLQFFQGIIVRTILPPAVVGTWNYVGVTQGFMNTFDLGITAGAGRELPLLRGAGRTDEEQLARSTAFWGRTAQSLLFAAVIIGVTATGYREGAWNVALTAAILLLLASGVESYTCFRQSIEDYGFLGRANVFGAVTMFAGVIVGGYAGGATGIMVGAVVAMALKLLFLAAGWGRTGSLVVPVFNGAILRRLVSFGLPMRLMDYPLSLFTMLDVLVISQFLTATELGVYMTAKIVTMMAIEGPAKLNTVYLSRLYIRSGENRDRHELGRTLRQFLIAQYMIVLPLATVGTWWFAKIMIEGLLPRYEAALEPTRLLLLTAFVVPQTSMVRNFWMIDKRLKAIGIVNACGLAGMLLLMTGIVSEGELTLERVGAAYLAGFSLHFVFLMATVGREVWGLRSTLKVGLAALGSMAYSGGIMTLVKPAPVTGGLIAMLRESAVPAFGSLALLIPLMWAGWKWSGVKGLRP